MVNCFVLPYSPINAPISSSFAGALRWINISSSSSGALMTRPLNSANYTELFKGVRFSEVLPRVRREFLSWKKGGGGYFIATETQLPEKKKYRNYHWNHNCTWSNNMPLVTSRYKVETKQIACAKRGRTCNRCQGKGKCATGAKRNKMRLRKVKILLVLLLLLVTVSKRSAFFVSGGARY